MNVKSVQISDCYNRPKNVKQPHFGDIPTSGSEASAYFSGGDTAFKKTIDVIKKVSENNPKPRILIVGIGKLQEPLSVLAVVKDLNKDKKLEDSVILECLDTQRKFNAEKEYLYYDQDQPPPFAKDSFIFDNGKYRVNDEISEYMQKTLNDPQLTSWETRIQDFKGSKTGERYDLVLINNVFPCIAAERNCNQFVRYIIYDILQVLRNVTRKNGYLITDVHIPMIDNDHPPAGFNKLAPGVFQRWKWNGEYFGL